MRSWGPKASRPTPPQPPMPPSAASLGNLASALVPIITAAGGVVTAQTLAALLPTVIAAAGSSAQNATGKPANPSA